MNSVASPAVNESLIFHTIMFHVLLVLIMSLLSQKLKAVGMASSVHVVTCFTYYPECQCPWDEMEELFEQYMETDLVQLRLEEDDITRDSARNLVCNVYKFLVKTLCGSLGRGKRYKNNYYSSLVCRTDRKNFPYLLTKHRNVSVISQEMESIILGVA